MKTTHKKNQSSRSASNIMTPLEFATSSSLPFDLRPTYLKKGLTETNMEALYITAYNLYESEKISHALPYFKLMALLNPYDKRGWLGCGACFEIIKSFTSAISCYKAAAITDINDPMPLFRIFHCCLEINDKKNALKSLEAAIKAAEKQPGLFSKLKEQAINIRNILVK